MSSEVDIINLLRLLSPYLLAILGALISVGLYMMKRMISKLDALEAAQCKKVDRATAREMINDKIYPIEKRIDKIDEKLDKIIQLLIRKD